MDSVDLVELAPRMRPTCDFVNIFAVEVMEAGIGVGLKSTVVSLQVLARMFSLAIGRVGKPYCGWRRLARCAIITHIGPETCCPGLATARREHSNRSVIGMQLAAGKNMLLQCIDERREQIA
jgi:hypothetical protein